MASSMRGAVELRHWVIELRASSVGSTSSELLCRLLEQPDFNRWLRLSERLALSQLRLLPPLLSRQGTSVLRYTRQLVKLPSTAQERTVLDVKVLRRSGFFLFAFGSVRSEDSFRRRRFGSSPAVARVCAPRASHADNRAFPPLRPQPAMRAAEPLAAANDASSRCSASQTALGSASSSDCRRFRAQNQMVPELAASKKALVQRLRTTKVRRRLAAVPRPFAGPPRTFWPRSF